MLLHPAGTYLALKSILLLFSSTVSPARQMDCSLTHAESMWVNELEDFDPRIRLPSIETCFPLRSSIHYLNELFYRKEESNTE